MPTTDMFTLTVNLLVRPKNEIYVKSVIYGDCSSNSSSLINFTSLGLVESFYFQFQRRPFPNGVLRDFIATVRQPLLYVVLSYRWYYRFSGFTFNYFRLHDPINRSHCYAFNHRVKRHNVYLCAFLPVFFFVSVYKRKQSECLVTVCFNKSCINYTKHTI